jgi:hypothetical protein
MILKIWLWAYNNPKIKVSNQIWYFNLLGFYNITNSLKSS